MPKLKSKFIAEHNAESELEQLAREKTQHKLKQGLEIFLGDVLYVPIAGGIGALLGYINGENQASTIEGAKQALVAGLPFLAYGNILRFLRFNNVDKTKKRIEETIWTNENPQISVGVGAVAGAPVYYIGAVIINKLFGTNLEPAFCAQAGILFGAINNFLMAYITGSYYKKEIMKKLKNI